ncbi:uncharacterized protein [Antedon mediterranea]|uniref:uncharacterized protein n=1 Tax=Antedon mediterranea TaxID=105859 RepID=UPI003AF54B43
MFYIRVVILFATALVISHAQVSEQWNISIELQGSSLWGYVQVLKDGQLKYICNDYWDIEDGRVVCTQLGLGDVFTVSGETYPTENTIPDGFLCDGTESTLTECQRTSDLPGDENTRCNAAYVSCGPKDSKVYDWKEIGCFQDNNNRILPDLKCDESTTEICRHCLNDTGQYFCADYHGMTVDLCLQVCCGYGYTYAGLQNGDQCFCGHESADYSRYGEKPSTDCSSECEGNAGQDCGGIFNMKVYECIYPDASTIQDISTESSIPTSSVSPTSKRDTNTPENNVTPPMTTEYSSSVTVSKSSEPSSSSTYLTSTKSNEVSMTNGVTVPTSSKEPTKSSVTSSSTEDSSRITVSKSNEETSKPFSTLTSSISTQSKVSMISDVTMTISSKEPTKSSVTSSSTEDSSRITVSRSNEETSKPFSTLTSSISTQSKVSMISDVTMTISSKEPTKSSVTPPYTITKSTKGPVSSSVTSTRQYSTSDGDKFVKTTIASSTGDAMMSRNPSEYSTSMSSVRNTDGPRTSEQSLSSNLPSNNPTTSFNKSLTTSKVQETPVVLTTKKNNENPVPKDSLTSNEEDDSFWYWYMILGTVCLLPIVLILFRCFCWKTSKKHKFNYSQNKPSKIKGELADDCDFDSIDDNCIVTKGTIVDEEVQPVPIPSYLYPPPTVNDNQKLIEKDDPEFTDWNVDNNGVVNTGVSVETETKPINGDVEAAVDAADLYSRVDFSKKKNRRMIDMNNL